MVFLALCAALCTGLAAIITAEVADRAGGPLAISRWRSLTAACVLAGAATLVGHAIGLGHRYMPAVAGSSLAAAVVGEFCLNKAYRDLGARRAALLFAGAAPFSVLVGWLFLGEAPSLAQLGGIALVVAGLVLAIWFSPLHRGQGARHNESVASIVAIIGGLCAGLAQALGNVMARSALRDGADPVAVMTFRAIVAAFAFWGISMMLRAAGRQERLTPPRSVLAAVILSACLSFALGNTLLMVALKSGQTAIVTTFAATTPVMLLPLMWWRSGRCPSPLAWAGAALTVAGIACIAMAPMRGAVAAVPPHGDALTAPGISAPAAPATQVARLSHPDR